MATAEPTPPYTDEQLESDNVSKKDIIQCLQEIASLRVSAKCNHAACHEVISFSAC